MQEGWLGAEAWDATRQLDAACDAYAAWQPAAEQLLQAAAGEEDMLPETPRSRWAGRLMLLGLAAGRQPVRCCSSWCLLRWDACGFPEHCA